MTYNLKLTKDQHRYLGIELNRLTWKFLEHQGRTAGEEDTMVHLAHSSKFHWSFAGTNVNAVRGDWLISHVYAVLGRSAEALHYAKLCLEGTEGEGFKDFDIAYAEEAMARALAASGDLTQANEFFQRAKQAGNAIVDPEDRMKFLSDFKAGPWYGVEDA